MEKKLKKLRQDKIKRDIIRICNGQFDEYNENKKYIIFKIIIEYLAIAVGTLIMAIGISFLLLPNELSTGGFSGLATILYYLFKLPVGQVMVALNIPLLIISYFKIGKKFIIKSIYGIFTLSLFVDLLDGFTFFTTDRFLACIYGGILSGIGTAIVLKLGASTGGSDLFSYIIREYKPQYRASNIILGFDFIVITLNVIFFKTIEVGLYSVIAIYLMGKMIDIIFEGTNFAKTLLIISSKYQQIATEIGKSLNRGSTGIYSKGMYTNEEKMMLLCVGSRTEAYNMESIAKKIDKNSFIIILNAREVLGKGFK